MIWAVGQERDSIRSDIGRGIPTLSFEADELFRRLIGLSDTSQSEALDQQATRWLAGIDRIHLARWHGDLQLYLGDLDPQAVASLAVVLKLQLDERARDARRRGWDVD